jgi:L-ribulose-5-phosphate 3-epimerase
MNDRLSRRGFLKISTGAAAAAVMAPLVATAAEEPAKKKPALKKAIMYATLSYKGSLVEQFKAVKAAGFDGVEPMSHMKQDEVVKALEESGLKAASVCCNTHWGQPLSHPDADKRREGVEGLRIALKDAKRYGASSVLLVPGVVNKEVNYDDCWKRSVASIKEALPLAKELDVKIAIENVWNDFITKPEQARDFLDAIDSPLVGWHFDIGNAVRYSPPETWIPILGKRILKLHIKEYRKTKVLYEGFKVRLNEGDNNWPAIMKALNEVGYEGWGISEQPGEQSKNEDALKDLAGSMDKAFAS